MSALNECLELFKGLFLGGFMAFLWPILWANW